MKKITKKEAGIAAAIIAILLVVGYFAVYWLITCGFIALICLCFGLEFNWLHATGVWLGAMLLSGIINSRNRD